MNGDRLQEIGEPLALSRSDVSRIRKQGFGERLQASTQNLYLKVLAIFTGINGFSIGAIYSFCDGQSYPGMYHPPGGYSAPIRWFSGLAGLGGLSAGAYIGIRNPKDRNARLFQIMVAVPFLIFAFIIGYVFGLFPTMSISFYNVYSGEEWGEGGRGREWNDTGGIRKVWSREGSA